MKKKYDIKIDNFEDRYGFYEWNKPSYYLTKSDKRYKNYQEYKKNTGIYPDELWSLDISICNFIIPRLKEFKDTITDELRIPYIYKPDVLVKQTKEDFLIKKDTVLEFALSYSKGEKVKKKSGV